MPDSPRLVPSSCHAGQAPANPPPRVPLGIGRLDDALGGGLPRGRLHDVRPAAPADRTAATGFALMLAALAAGARGTIAYLTEEQAERRGGALHGPGLVELGIDPARLILVRVPDLRALLRTAGDVVRSPAIAAAVVAPARPHPLLDLTFTRRLTLFAERSGGTAFLLGGMDAAQPSAAATRWRVAAAASQVLEADAPGPPAFLAELVRLRGGPPVPAMRLEWRRDDARFQALPGDLAAVAGGGDVAVA